MKPVTILKSKQIKQFSSNYILGQRVVYLTSNDFVFPLMKGDVLLLHRETKNCKNLFMIIQIVNFKWCSSNNEYVIQAYERGFTRRTKGMNFE